PARRSRAGRPERGPSVPRRSSGLGGARARASLPRVAGPRAKRPSHARISIGLQSSVMCMQCMATAMTAGGAGAGRRAWVAGQRRAWLDQGGLRVLTAAILAAGVLASGSHLAPNGAGPGTASAAAPSGAAAESTEPIGRTLLAVAKASGVLEAIEGSL